MGLWISKFLSGSFCVGEPSRGVFETFLFESESHFVTSCSSRAKRLLNPKQHPNFVRWFTWHLDIEPSFVPRDCLAWLGNTCVKNLQSRISFCARRNSTEVSTWTGTIWQINPFPGTILCSVIWTTCNLMHKHSSLPPPCHQHIVRRAKRSKFLKRNQYSSVWVAFVQKNHNTIGLRAFAHMPFD